MIADEPVLLMEPVTAWRVWWATRVEEQWRLYSIRGSDASGGRATAMWDPHQPHEARHVGVAHSMPLAGGYWFVPPSSASNDTSDHESPCECGEAVGNLGCGIYALKASQAGRLFDGAPGWVCSAADTVTILGMVSLWGRIVEHAFGYRAQYAYPKAICDRGLACQTAMDPFGIDLTTRAVREIADAYGVPIMHWNEGINSQGATV